MKPLTSRPPTAPGRVVFGLDLHNHEAFAEHSNGASRRIALTPNRSVGEVAREVLEAAAALAGPVKIDPAPQEVWWTVPLDEDREHSSYDTNAVERYFAAATNAALVLSAYRAPYRGRSTPVNAWWGSFDLAVSLFSGAPADPPSADFIMRNAMDSQEVAIGWWPGDPRYPKAAFYAYAYPSCRGLRALVAVARCGSLGRWPRRVRARLERRHLEPGSTPDGAGICSLGSAARLYGVSVGPCAACKRRGESATDQVRSAALVVRGGRMRSGDRVQELRDDRAVDRDRRCRRRCCGSRSQRRRCRGSPSASRRSSASRLEPTPYSAVPVLA